MLLMKCSKRLYLCNAKAVLSFDQDFNIWYKDAVLVEKRHQALEAARRKMQEELDAQAAIFKEKQKQVQ